MNKIRLFSPVLAVCLVITSASLYAFKFDFVTSRNIVNKVRNRFGKLKTYQARFRIVSTKFGKKSVKVGRIRYKASDRLLIEFSNGQKIISNGKMMWIHIPQLNVVAIQDLKRKDTGLFMTTKSGLRRLFAKYHYRFASKKQPEETKAGKFYTLILKQKESRSGFRRIKLWITENYMIKKAVGKSSTGKKVEIVFYKVKTNVAMKNGLFRFTMPKNIKVIKNPMMEEVK